MEMMSGVFMEMMSQDIAKLAEALAKARVEFRTISKNQTVETNAYTFKYADLAEVQAAVMPALSKNGLSILQPILTCEGKRCLVTILSHSSGQWIKGCMEMPNSAKMQDIGKDITYLMRYALCSMLCVASEDDVDANDNVLKVEEKPKKSIFNRHPDAANDDVKKIEDKPKNGSNLRLIDVNMVKTLNDLTKDDLEYRAKILGYYKIPNFEKLPLDVFDLVLEKIQIYNMEKVSE